jgi:RHS repeat-associated protein
MGNAYKWTPFALPRQIVGRSAEATLSYDGSGMRVATDLNNGNSNGSYRVVDLAGLFHLRTDAQGIPLERTYTVSAPSGAVVQILREPNPASQSSRMIHSDHLGSPDAITSNGALIERGKYEPYGERRDPSEIGRPLAQPNAADSTLGFTGQQPDDPFHLVNMRGRLYDPLTAHFISPDPILSPRLSEGLNAYSYVRNSPLSLTDPTGFDGNEIELPLDASSATTFDFDVEPDMLNGGPPINVVTNMGDGLDSIPVLPSSPAAPSSAAPLAYSVPPSEQTEVAPEVAPPSPPLELWPSAPAPIIAPVPAAATVTLPPEFPAQTGAPNILPGMCLGGVCDNGPPTMNLNTYSGPFERFHAQVMSQFDRDVKVTMFGINVALALATSGGSLVAEGAVEAGVAEGASVAAEEASTSEQTFRILNGVRRSKAAQQAGKSSMRAEVVGSGGKFIDVPINALRSPKASIDLSTSTGMSRWLNTLKQTMSGSEPPPILVQPGTVGTPIQSVTFTF